MRAKTSLAAVLVTSVTLLLTFSAAAQDRHAFDERTLETVHGLSEQALESDLAYDITRSLTTEIGPRLAGTEQEARARDWAVAKLRELGFENVRVEPFEVDLWTRGDSVFEEAAIVAPYPQPLPVMFRCFIFNSF